MNPVSIFITCLIALMSSCEDKEKLPLIEVSNNLDLHRTYETVEIKLGDFKIEKLEQIGIQNSESGEVITSQLVDTDGDGIMDQLLFQPELAPNSKATFQIIYLPEGQNSSDEKICYSRFVPERTDDYAWENNKVAFRTYGPNAQYRYENKLEEGTLSSGIDAWLKRVDHSIIDGWYKKYTEKTGTYHEDTGEGLDNFHVGSSRGVGGIAFKKDSTYYISKNFKSYKTLTNGPIRTSFVLDYGTWDADSLQIKESKHISLDYGNNLSRFEVSLEGVDSISAGLTLHENDGAVTSRDGETWLNYWQPHDDSELGTAIVSTSDYYIDYDKFETDKKDLSNAFANLKVIDGKVVYYAGFTWKKSNQFKSQTEWETYLRDFSKKINNPLTIKVINNQ